MRTVRLADDEVLIPGLVDTHVHVNEPGRTEWEGFATATRAAAAGGVTTIVDMPLNSIPPTTSVGGARVEARRRRRSRSSSTSASGAAWCPATRPTCCRSSTEGVFGFKCFLVDSGVDEFPPVTADEMERGDGGARRGPTRCSSCTPRTPSLIDAAPHPHSREYADFLASRPRAAEHAAISAVIEAAARTGARAHILHLSSADALEPIAAAKRDGVRLSAETCPHYLMLAAEDVAPGATAFKCCPPIREGGEPRRALARARRPASSTSSSPTTRRRRPR